MTRRFPDQSDMKRKNTWTETDRVAMTVFITFIIFTLLLFSGGATFCVGSTGRRSPRLTSNIPELRGTSQAKSVAGKKTRTF